MVEAEAVAGDGDDALDEMHGWIDGVVKDDEVAAMNRRGARTWRMDSGSTIGGRAEEVADEQGGDHHSDGMRKGWTDECDDEERDDDNVEQRAEG